MSNFDKNRFASNKQEYVTPDKLFKVLDNEFHFTFDLCADNNNAKVNRFYTIDDNALERPWNGICWMNPPYKDMKKWIIKAYEQTRKENIVVCLIPARTNTNWWHEYCMKGEIRFIKGRPKFEGCIHGLPQPLAIVIFGINYHNNYKSVNF